MNPLNILSKFVGKQDTRSESFLSLVLTPDRVLALIWDFQNEEVKNLGFGKKSYQNLDVLIHQAAVAIDIAGEQAKVDVQKVVFGLTDEWFEEGELTKQTTKLLKKLSDELDLNPQAFVPLPAAISHLLRIEDSPAPSAVLVGIFNDFCEVHLLENSKVSNSIISKAQINIEKITKIIAELKADTKELPAKIIVYGPSESSELSEKIAKHDWKNTFVHEPKVDFLDDSELVRAVAYAQAADILGFEPSQVGKSEVGPTEMESHVTHAVNELGFIEGEDILQNREQVEEPQLKSARDDRFLARADRPMDEAGGDYAVEPAPENLKPTTGSTPQEPEVTTTKTKTANLSFLPGKKIWMIIGAILLLFLVAGFLASNLLARAQVLVLVSPKPQEKDFTAMVVDGGSIDASKSQIGGQIVEGTADGSQKTVTSGSKKVGDSAKGEVNILNWTDSPKTFQAKTGIITKNGIKFTIDSDVDVASRSASTFLAGQSKTTATAVEVGAIGNVDAGTDLTFQQFDAISYSAQAAGSFSGGTERQTTVVIQEDMDRLVKSLTDTLTQKARDDLRSKSASAKVQDDAVTIKIITKTFDKKLNEEASVLNLDMQIEASAIVYDEGDLKKLLSEIIKGDIPTNLEARAENIDIGDLKVTRQESKLKLTGKIKASLVPKFNEAEIKSKIAGKSVKDARAAILATGQAADVQINFSPNLPFIFSLPRDKGKITFKIETN